MAGGSDSQEPIQSSEHEKKFLREVYDTISEILVGSVNDTTSYCPNTISSAQSGRGSSLDNANQRGKYMSLCLSGVTSQVLNVSFRNKFSSPAKDKCYVQVKEASNTVIEFLLSAGTKFWNDYSLIHFNSMKLNWEEGKNEIFHVPGGLLFPILTAALISFRTEKGIAFVAESYGGKTRGKHLHWKFKEANRENISEIVNGINLIEETKVPFIVKNAFRAIQSKWPSSVKNVSIHWGLGSDAKGSILRSGKPSFLVCQPVNIDSVDTCRTGLTKDVFRNKNMSCSSTATRSEAGKVSSDSDTDSDSKLDEGVRQRFVLFRYLIIDWTVDYWSI